MGYFTDYHAKSLNQWMVKWGYAVAFTKYSKKYVSDEKTAKSFKIGIWKGPFEMPWDFREEKRIIASNSKRCSKGGWKRRRF